MSSRLEQFIRDHRESFDSDAPPKRVWDQLQHLTGDGKIKTRPVVWLTPKRWAVAVAISLLVAGGTWYLTQPVADNSRAVTVAAANKPTATAAPATAAQTSPGQGATEQTAQTASPAQTNQTASPAQTNQAAPAGSSEQGARSALPDSGPDALYRDKMGYYTNLVRIRHRELGTIEKDEPLLYKQFSGDVKKLDSVYRDLEKQLPDNPNREQLLQGMLQALQLQMKLLNHQLDIIKKINHSKKTAYEQAYKTT
jgi:hypothetical protein